MAGSVGTKSTTSDAYCWIGSSGGSWGSPADWRDTAAGTNPAALVPGTLTPVTITGPAGSAFEVIVGGGTAASVGLAGDLSLTGSYAVGGAVNVGAQTVVAGSSMPAPAPATTTLTAGALLLANGGTVMAGSVNVVAGTLSLTGTAAISSTGSVTIGIASGVNVPYNGTFAGSNGASGAISLAPGGTLSAAGGVWVNSGSLVDAGGLVGIGGTLSVGTAPSLISATPRSNAATGQVAVTTGGTLTVGGAITDLYGIVLAGGAGSRLIASGTLTAFGAGSYFYASTTTAGFSYGDLAAVNGGFVQLGGLVLDPPPGGPYAAYAPGLAVDSTSAIEVGSAGGAAPGAITIDAGRTITVDTAATLSGSLVDNGTLAIIGGTLTETGNVSGSGMVQIGTNATWTLDGGIGSGGTIAFLGGGAALSIGSGFIPSGTSSVWDPYAVGATITGLQTSDSIILAQPLATATYTAGTGTNPGTLVLSNGTSTIETLRLAGSFTGKNFFVSPTSGGGASISLTSAVPVPGGGTKSTTSDAYCWIGSSGGSWGSPADWRDTAAGTNPAALVPGTLTPVTITGPAGSAFEVIVGGGTAASVGLAGDLSLTGSYAVGGAVNVGAQTVVAGSSMPAPAPATTTLTAGALLLANGGTVTAGSVNVVAGTLSLTGTAAISSTGSVTIGIASGVNVPYNGTFAGSNGASGAISLAPGGTLSAAGGVWVNSGSLVDAGGLVGIGGTLSVGTAPSLISATPRSNAATGQVAVTTGGTLTVGGAITDLYGIVLAGGAGSRLIASGTLTAFGAGSYFYASTTTAGFSYGDLAAVNGGFVQLGGLVLDPPPGGPYAAYAPGLAVDSTSAIEVGSAGGAAPGAITIDAGRTITVDTAATLSGSLVDNGTLAIIGGTLTETGNVSGSGMVQIGTNATWTLDGGIGSGGTIAFLGGGAALSIGSGFIPSGTSSVWDPYAVGATITGLQTSDSIILAQPLATATYTAGTGTNPGTLVLSNGTSTIETLRLAGSFTGKNFFVSPTSGGGASISLTSAVPVPGGGTKSTTSDAYCWIGSSGGSWGSPADWRDTTAGTNPAAFVPGTLTPVTITGPAGSAFEVIVGGGTAASVALAGDLSLTGSYAVGGAVNVGAQTVVAGLSTPAPAPATTTLTAGALLLANGGTVTAGSVNVVAGTLSLAGSAAISSTGSVTIGTASGVNVPYNGTFAGSNGASGAISLAPGGTLSAAGGVWVNSGSLVDAGGLVGIGGTLSVGTAPSLISATPRSNAATGQVAVTAGGTLTVGGAITDLYGIVLAGGAGSRLIASGTLTAFGAGSYFYASTTTAGFSYGDLAAVNGGFVQLGGLVLDPPPGGPYAAYAPGLAVDSTSAIEVGSAGGAAPGAITIDAGRTITIDTAATLSGSLVDNGTLAIIGGTLTETGNVSGSGMVQIGTNATWTLDGGIGSGGTIAFLGGGAALSIGSGFIPSGTSSVWDPYAVGATITGLQTSDSIILAQPLATATYTAGTGTNPGTLVLSNGTSTIETLRLAGSFTGKNFFVSPTSGGGASISLTSAVPVHNYATIGIESLGSATLTHATTTWALGLGVAAQGSAALTDTLGIANLASGVADVLSGSFTVIGSSAFVNSGFATPFSGLGAGQDEHRQTIDLPTATVGVFTETIVAASSGSDATYSGVLPNQTITVTGTVVPNGNTYNLTAAPISIVGGAGNDVFNAASGALNSRDSLDGGGGNNILNLVGGGGIFDLGAPKLLANIQTVNATEGQPATTIYTRDGTPQTVNLNPAPSGAGAAIIYGGSDTDVFNLATGTDALVLGSAGESVHAGGGTALVQADAAFAGAVVTGGTTGTTTLEIIAGGTAALSNADSNLIVRLDTATHLLLGGARLITAIGSSGADTITAGASGQTLTGGGGADVLIGFSGYGDTFLDTASGFNGDTIGNFGGNDLIDITDFAFGSLKALNVEVTGSGTASTVTVSNGTHTTTITLLGAYTVADFLPASDGHTGTQIGFVKS